ncbi:MAG: glycine betaine/L-proline ABC transporter ATP-binding protein [Acidiferrobacterales bacterium]|nr:glycine betaine/L-proline ABC transporter ATP-binding protein [Acidiferrobacterales bacterium]
MSEPVIKLEDVWKIFGDRSAEAMEAVKKDGLTKPEVLEKFGCVVGVAETSFEVTKGEIFCVMGLSGSGKSTMVRHLNRLLEPTAGNINVLGKDVMGLNENDLREMRAAHIGMVFQHMALFPHRTVRDNVAFPLQVQGYPKNKRWEESQRCLSLVNLDGYEDRFPSELSGGMQQRVGLARALASDPEVLLMDEPFSALDPLIRRQLQEQFMALSADLGKTTVFITHDLDEAIRIGNRIAIMKDGYIVQIGTPEEIVTNPIDEYVSDFVEGISTLKLIFAHTIMDKIEEYQPQYGDDLSVAPRVSEDTDLSGLIDISTTTDQPIVIQNSDGRDVGVVNKTTLLKGIKGGDN